MWGRVLAGVGYALYLWEMGKAGSRRFWKSGCLDHEVPSGAFLAPKSDFVGHGMLWLFPRSTGHSFQLLQHWPLHVVILYLFSPFVSWASFLTWNRVLTFQQSILVTDLGDWPLGAQSGLTWRLRQFILVLEGWPAPLWSTSAILVSVSGIQFFYRVRLLAVRPTPNQEDQGIALCLTSTLQPLSGMGDPSRSLELPAA